MKVVWAVLFPKVCSGLWRAASQCSLKTGCHLGQVWQSHPVWFNLTDTVYPTGMESALTTHYACLYEHRIDKKPHVSLHAEMYRICCSCLCWSAWFVISFEKVGFPKLNTESCI